MDQLLFNLLRRVRPRVGWPQFVLGLAAVLCAATAATGSKLGLPSEPFFWGAALGFGLGLRLGRPPAAARRPAIVALRVALAGALLIAAGALLIIAAADTLPPIGLVSQDLGALAPWLRAALRRTAGWADRPELRSWRYLATTLPRFWANLIAAPSAGEPGARLIVLAGGLAGTWASALALGAALARGRNLFAWGLPTLATIGLIAILGGSAGYELIFGLALLLLLTIVVGARQRERGWERRGADFSTELIADVLVWGAGVVALVLVLAMLLPTSVSNPLADLLWRDIEVPSGIAVLQRNIQRPQTKQTTVDVGLSTLPVLELGLSLEQPPPGQVILRIRLAEPLPPAPAPRYWRARVLNLYNGRYWTTNARISQFDSIEIPDPLPSGLIVQEIEDLRRDRTLVVGLADVFGLDTDARAERLADGALVALTAPSANGPARYRVLSRPQELAPPPRPDGAPPDLSMYLGLPRGYSQRVRDLTRVVAGDQPRAYDQALAIEAYLRELPYAYQVQPLPAAGDAVEQFLFDMRAGYCTYYASAMAVMARSLGIPARVAVGYATGNYDQASRAYLVREADAHAWPELYIDGRWLPFEPTPIRTLPARGATEEIPTPVSAPAPAEQPSASGPLIWAGVLAAVALLVLLGIWRARLRPRTLVSEILQRLERGGRRAGVPWPPSATIREYGALLRPHAGGESDSLAEVVDLAGQARYSGRELRGDQEGRLRTLAERVLARLARRR